MAKKPNKAKGKPRVFSGLRTFDWRGPMRYLKPPRYLEIIGKASPNTITVANLEQFCEEKTGIDRNRTKTGVSSLQYFEKLVTLKHKMPDKTINKLKEEKEFSPCKRFDYFHNFIRGDPFWVKRIAFEENNVPRIRLDTDLYELWDAFDAWLKFRQEKAGTVCDNGW